MSCAVFRIGRMPSWMAPAAWNRLIGRAILRLGLARTCRDKRKCGSPVYNRTAVQRLRSERIISPSRVPMSTPIFALDRARRRAAAATRQTLFVVNCRAILSMKLAVCRSNSWIVLGPRRRVEDRTGRAMEVPLRRSNARTPEGRVRGGRTVVPSRSPQAVLPDRAGTRVDSRTSPIPTDRAVPQRRAPSVADRVPSRAFDAGASRANVERVQPPDVRRGGPVPGLETGNRVRSLPNRAPSARPAAARSAAPRAAPRSMRSTAPAVGGMGRIAAPSRTPAARAPAMRAPTRGRGISAGRGASGGAPARGGMGRGRGR